MKFFTLFTIVFFLCLPLSYAQNSNAQSIEGEDLDRILDQANVRGFIWGLPKEIIRAEEKGEFVEESEEGDVLFFLDKIRGMHVSLNYEFEDNKLHRVRIFSENGYPLPSHRLDDLMQMKRDLVQRFGEPIDEQMIWKNNKNKMFPDMWGYDVLLGDLKIIINWESSDTLVTAYLGEGKELYEPILFITYEDRRAKLLKIKQQQKDVLEIAPKEPRDTLPQAPSLLP